MKESKELRNYIYFAVLVTLECLRGRPVNSYQRLSSISMSDLLKISPKSFSHRHALQ